MTYLFSVFFFQCDHQYLHLGFMLWIQTEWTYIKVSSYLWTGDFSLHFISLIHDIFQENISVLDMGNALDALSVPWARTWILCQGMRRSFSSVQFSHSVVSSSLPPHGLQHATPPYPSPTPGVYSNSCPLSWWCHPTISSSVIHFSSDLQPFPASGSFQMSQFFASGGQSIGVSASPSVLPMNIQHWFP